MPRQEKKSPFYHRISQNKHSTLWKKGGLPKLLFLPSNLATRDKERAEVTGRWCYWCFVFKTSSSPPRCFHTQNRHSHRTANYFTYLVPDTTPFPQGVLTMPLTSWSNYAKTPIGLTHSRQLRHSSSWNTVTIALKFAIAPGGLVTLLHKLIGTRIGDIANSNVNGTIENSKSLTYLCTRFKFRSFCDTQRRCLLFTWMCDGLYSRWQSSCVYHLFGIAF